MSSTMSIMKVVNMKSMEDTNRTTATKREANTSPDITSLATMRVTTARKDITRREDTTRTTRATRKPPVMKSITVIKALMAKKAAKKKERNGATAIKKTKLTRKVQ